MLLNKRPPALPRINVESTEKQKTKLSEIQVKQTVVLRVEVLLTKTVLCK
jgi:hypothetical protein